MRRWLRNDLQVERALDQPNTRYQHHGRGGDRETPSRVLPASSQHVQHWQQLPNQMQRLRILEQSLEPVQMTVMQFTLI